MVFVFGFGFLAFLLVYWGFFLGVFWFVFLKWICAETKSGRGEVWGGEGVVVVAAAALFSGGGFQLEKETKLILKSVSYLR